MKELASVAASGASGEPAGTVPTPHRNTTKATAGAITRATSQRRAPGPAARGRSVPAAPIGRRPASAHAMTSPPTSTTTGRARSPAGCSSKNTRVNIHSDGDERQGEAEAGRGRWPLRRVAAAVAPHQQHGAVDHGGREQSDLDPGPAEPEVGQPPAMGTPRCARRGSSRTGRRRRGPATAAATRRGPRASRPGRGRRRGSPSRSAPDVTPPPARPGGRWGAAPAR